MIEFQNFKQGVSMRWIDNHLNVVREIKFYGSNTPEATCALTEAFSFEIKQMRKKHPTLTKAALENWLSEIQERAIRGEFGHLL